MISLLGHEQSDAVFSYYRVLDQDVLQSLDWLRENVDSNSVVVASGNQRGFHYSWWIEGYSKIPSYSATDPRSFSYKEEKEQTAVAHMLLSSAPADEVSRLARQYGLRYVFLDKRVVEPRSELLQAGFNPVFENARVLILGYASDIGITFGGTLLDEPSD